MVPEQRQIRMSLSEEQQAQIKEFFGEDVQELTLTVDEFETSPTTPKLKVLKVDNIAFIQGADINQVVN